MTSSHTTRVPLYSTKLRLKVTDDERVFLALGSGDAEALTYTQDDPFCVVIILRPRAAPGTVAHECLHAVKRVLDHAGVRFNTSTEETYAYTLDWVVEWVSSKLSSHASTSRKAA